VKKLEEMKHRRGREKKFFWGGFYDKQRDDSKKKHDALIDFDRLSNTIQNYDRQQVIEIPEIIGLD